MKVTLKYEESAAADLHMTLRLTLPQKYVNGCTKELVKLFVEHYNKKHTESQLSADVLHLKIVGGEHLKPDARVRDTMANGDECYLLGNTSQPTKRVAPSSAGEAAAGAAASSGPSSSSNGTAAKVVRDDQGRVRCKRFGCNKFYDPEGPEQKCVHHKAPPIFHETAKWWSCCPNQKAYDWEEFMKIPGCMTSFCSSCPEGQQNQKRFLGGSDLRGDCAPVRLDADAPRDPRHTLTDLMKGLVAVGVDQSLFEKVWAKLASETDDLEAVCEKFRTRFQAILTTAEP